MKLLYIRSAVVGLMSAASFALAEPPEIIEETIDAKDLGLGPMGFRIESTDFEADPNRQLVVTLTAKREVIDIRGRYSTPKAIEEWAVYYHDGSPILAQLKKWNKVSFDGDELGEALVMVETFLAKDGKFEIDGKNAKKRIMDMRAFAEARQAEQDGARQPDTAVDSKSEGKEKPKPESEARPQ